MKEADIKKVVELQGKILKLKDRIMQDVAKHNSMVVNDLRSALEGVQYSTIYQVGDMTYKRGRVFCQLQCDEYGLGVKADGLATLRKITVETENAPSNDTKSGPTAPLSE